MTALCQAHQLRLCILPPAGRPVLLLNMYILRAMLLAGLTFILLVPLCAHTALYQET